MFKFLNYIMYNNKTNINKIYEILHLGDKNNFSNFSFCPARGFPGGIPAYTS
jgi:hypothetical protein